MESDPVRDIDNQTCVFPKTNSLFNSAETGKNVHNGVTKTIQHVYAALTNDMLVYLGTITVDTALWPSVR